MAAKKPAGPLQVGFGSGSGTVRGIKLFVTGTKEIDAAIAAFEPALQKTVARKAIREASKPVARMAAAKAPKDTGDYAKTFKVSAFKRSRKHPNRIGVKVANSRVKLKQIAEKRTAERAGVDYEIAKKTRSQQFINPHWLEFGTSKMAAQPHVRPALEAGKSSVPAEFKRLLPPIVAEVTRKVAAKKQAAAASVPTVSA